MKRVVTFIFFSACILSCSNDKRKSTTAHITDYLITEKDLVPEGVAWDKKTKTIFVSSTYRRKIVQIDSLGRITDLVPQEKDGIWSTVGMEVDAPSRKLWANTAHANQVMPLAHPDPANDWMTAVVCFDIDSGEMLKKYVCKENKSFFNDLTVGPDGNIYVTETVNSRIYRIDTRKDTLEVFTDLPGYSFANGITGSGKPDVLFVSCSEGILALNINTKAIQPLDTANVETKGIDGLAYYNNSLIGHRSKVVQRFYLSANKTAIDSIGILAKGKEFDSSTTGEIADDDYLFIVNSQIRSGVDYKNRTIKPYDSLENIIIRKIQLHPE